MDVAERVRVDDDFRQRACAWLLSNGVDPKDVPADERPSIFDGTLTLCLFVRTPEGHLTMEPGNARPATTTVSVPVAVQPDEDIAAWLIPRCPTCNR